MTNNGSDGVNPEEQEQTVVGTSLKKAGRYVKWVFASLLWAGDVDENPDLVCQLESQIQQAQSRAKQEHDRNLELETEIGKLRKQIRHAQRQATDAVNQAKDAQNTIRAGQVMIQQLQQKILSLESRHKRMNLTIKEQEAQIRQVQTLAFERIDGDSWAAGDDSTVRADLENLHGRIKNWAKKHAIEDMESVEELTLDQYKSLVGAMSKVVRLRALGDGECGDGRPAVIQHLQTARVKKKSPAMCVQGLVAHHIYTKIINSPFFVLGNHGASFQDVYEELKQGKPSIIREVYARS
ncbi:hypothetical protein MMYC01_210030 [Madurella mycetomatis]|uniref:Uncharacterized protein n=1 Tax=Madurella mycetomatis TaxID=100816 RepID=A0A175VPS4_9PEZI|nr:hypothetical protein MMYC01_210030 [Madurella mycetomatis]